MRFLRIMSENDDRTAERFRAVEQDKPAGSVEFAGGGVQGEGKAVDKDKVEDGGVGVVEVVGEGVEGDGKAVNEDGVEDGGVGVGGGEGGAADEVFVPNVVAVPRPYSDQAVNAMTADQAQAAVASGMLTVP